MRQHAVRIWCAAVLMAACTPAPDPFAVLEGMPEWGKATEFSELKYAPYSEFADDLPKGVPASAVRIGNDGCYYYVNGDKMVPMTNKDGVMSCLQI